MRRRGSSPRATVQKAVFYSYPHPVETNMVVVLDETLFETGLSSRGIT
jgi:hypothetical protein